MERRMRGPEAMRPPAMALPSSVRVTTDEEAERLREKARAQREWLRRRQREKDFWGRT